MADDRWYEELTRLLDKPRERRKLAKRGRKWVASETLAKHAGEWERALADAREHARAA